MIGMLSRGWGNDLKEKNLSEIDFVVRLLDGHTVGSAMEPINRRCAVRASMLSETLLEGNGSAQMTATVQAGIIGTHNARAWTILGDPAVYLSVSPAGAPAARPPSPVPAPLSGR